MSTQAEPPQTPKAAATRARLLELAGAMFVERGYNAVSLRDIAVEAGMTKGAIYGHFASKGQLLVAVVQKLQSELDENIGSGDDFALFLRPESADLRLVLVDAAAAARHDADVATGVTELYAERTRWLVENIGDFYQDPATTFFIINAVTDGIGMIEAFGDELPSAKAFRKTMAAMLNAVSRENP